MTSWRRGRAASRVARVTFLRTYLPTYCGQRALLYDPKGEAEHPDLAPEDVVRSRAHLTFSRPSRHISPYLAISRQSRVADPTPLPDPLLAQALAPASLSPQPKPQPQSEPPQTPAPNPPLQSVLA
eukprot:scaffold110144_cov60-Phaeocystis_antarctica.AAC.4